MSVGQELVRFGRELIGRTPAETPREIQRFGDPSFQAYVDAALRYQGQVYQPGYTTTIGGQRVEPVQDTFLGYIQGLYKANGVIFAISMARARPFSEIAFKFRRKGQAGGGSDLFGNRELDVLDVPWPNGTTQDLLMRAEQDVTGAGTFFVAREDGFGDTPDRLRRLRPDWCEFVLTAPPDKAVASDIVGVKYTPGGPWSGAASKVYLAIGPSPEVAFWAPIPDPDAQFRGMSWLTPIIEELQGDKAATTHKLKFFENAATPNLSVSLKESIGPEKFKQFVQQMNDATVGVDQAYKTLYTGGGADVRVIGADMRQLDFAITQGHGETRAAAAGGVPPIIVGLSEGLQAATYSNYGQAKRAYGDLFLRSQWRSFCGAIAPIIVVPNNANLWYDAKDVAFLREDNKDLADIQTVQAATISSLISSGFTPESSVEAVMAEDFSLLKHSGLVSVQLQPPGGAPGADPAADPAVAADPNAVPEPDPAEAAQSDASLASALDSIGA
jgi:phage portal protein BeeE